MLATACAAPETAEDDVDAGTAQQALVTEEPVVNPVVVTSGTCASKGFEPIRTAAACQLADATVFAEKRFTSGPLDTPPAPVPAAGPGCSVDTIAPSTQGAPSEMRAVFNPGTEAALLASTCSHDRPCLCNEVAPSPGAACRDGVFQPDPHKYYTLRSPNGRYIRKASEPEASFRRHSVIFTPIEGDARQPYASPSSLLSWNISQTNTPSAMNFHWRFSAKDDGFHAIDRSKGFQLEASEFVGFNLEGTLQTTPRDPSAPPITVSCRGSRAVLDFNGLSPVDPGGLYRDSPQMNFITPPFVPMRPQSPGIMKTVSTCMRKTTHCDTFGPGYVQIDRDLCGTWKERHRLTCKNNIYVPVSMHVPQAWSIEEVTEYSRAVNFDPAPVTVAPIGSAASAGNNLATFGIGAGTAAGAGLTTVLTNAKIAANSGPLFGALFSIGAGFLPGGAFDFGGSDPTAQLASAVTEALQTLAIDLTAQTEEMVENAIIGESARQLNSRMEDRRDFFYQFYPPLRQGELALDDPQATKNLANRICQEALDAKADINVALPNVSIGSSIADLKRAHFSLTIARLAAVESMTMMSEGILLDALATPEQTCNEVLTKRSLQTLANGYTDKLELAVDALVAFGRSSQDNREHEDADEFEFDARNFSYDVQPQVAFINDIVQTTLDKCERLRDPQDPFRAHFIANTPIVPELCHGDDATGDSDGSGTCDGALAKMAGPWSEATTAGSLDGISSPLLEDVDDDGDLDVVTRHHNQRRLVQWTNVGGALTEGLVAPLSTKPLGHDLADLDGDGDLDLLAGGTSNARLVFVENAATTFDPNHVLVNGASFKSVLAMPVDGDDRPDLVAFDGSNQELVLLHNISDTAGIAFDAASTIDNSLSSTSFTGPGLAALDVDDDGDLDLVVSTGALTLYTNEAGVFSAPVTIDAVNLGSTLYTADLDRDGDEDIVGVLGGNAVWYENLGNGGFNAQQSVALGNFAVDLAVGDLDGDGDRDVVLRDSNTGELIWVENGLNGLVLRAPIGVVQGAFVVGDLDGDGDGDVAAVDGTLKGMRALMNPLF